MDLGQSFSILDLGDLEKEFNIALLASAATFSGNRERSGEHGLAREHLESSVVGSDVHGKYLSGQTTDPATCPGGRSAGSGSVLHQGESRRDRLPVPHSAAMDLKAANFKLGFLPHFLDCEVRRAPMFD